MLQTRKMSMEKRMLLFAVLCKSLLMSAQTPYIPFPEDSAQWSIRATGVNPVNGQGYILSYQLKMNGDTIINGVAYNKIYKSYDLSYPSLSDSLHCFIRQDTAARKVYVRFPFNLYNEFPQIPITFYRK